MLGAVFLKCGGKKLNIMIGLNFRSRFDFVKSVNEKFGLDDEFANTFLWMLEMWDAKKELPEPTEFKLTSQVATGLSASTSLDGCPFHYCDGKVKCEGKCRYNHDKGICKEKNCKEIAKHDYNGCKHYVCEYHYKKLNDYFDDEYR